MTRILTITDHPDAGTVEGLPPQPARLWTNFQPNGFADFASMRLDPCIMRGQLCDMATFDRIAAETGMIYWQDTFGAWKDYNAPPKLCERYLRTYRAALQDLRRRSYSDAKLLITDFEGLTTDRDGYLQHDAREEFPWRFVVADTWYGRAGNYNCVRMGHTGKEPRGKNFVWPDSEVSCPICYDNGETPDGLDAVLDMNGPGAVVFVRPDRPYAAEFIAVARRRMAAYVILFCAQDDKALEMLALQTAAKIAGEV